MSGIQYPITTLFHLNPPSPFGDLLPYISHLQNNTIKTIILKSNLDALLTNRLNLFNGLKGSISSTNPSDDDGVTLRSDEIEGLGTLHSEKVNGIVDCEPFFALNNDEPELTTALQQELESIRNVLLQNASNTQKKALEESHTAPSVQLIIFSIYQLYRDALRLRISVEAFHTDLCALMEETYSQKEKRTLKQSGEYDKEINRAANLLSGYYKRRRDALLQDLSPRKTHDSLVNFRWRVDVTISNSMMSRVFTPVIWMQMTLDNGRQETFEVSLEKFHQLRLETADILKQMHEIQSHPMMNIHEK